MMPANIARRADDLAGLAIDAPALARTADAHLLIWAIEDLAEQVD